MTLYILVYFKLGWYVLACSRLVYCVLVYSDLVYYVLVYFKYTMCHIIYCYIKYRPGFGARILYTMLRIKLGCHVLSHTLYQYICGPSFRPELPICQNLGHPSDFL